MLLLSHLKLKVLYYSQLVLIFHFAICNLNFTSVVYCCVLRLRAVSFRSVSTACEKRKKNEMKYPNAPISLSIDFTFAEVSLLNYKIIYCFFCFGGSNISHQFITKEHPWNLNALNLQETSSTSRHINSFYDCKVNCCESSFSFFVHSTAYACIYLPVDNSYWPPA